MKIKTIVADPPWNERGGGKIKRGADKHYGLMKVPDIIELMQKWLDEEEHEENQHLYLWVTNQFLADGLKVMEALGFTYKTNVVWYKNSPGIGRYFRGKHEICLFGVKGRGFAEDLRTESNSVPSAFEAKKRQHSRKPEEFFTQILQKRSHGPYLEMFARSSRGKDWIVKGNQTDKFDGEKNAE
tara:strand:+ start:4364 stop:4915 length:552 start_codon:yes stop_codon:yes gene_type:complete